MKYLPDEVQHIDFKDLLSIIRKGQLFGLNVDFASYGGESNFRAYATVIRQSGYTQKITVGPPCSSKQDLWAEVEKALLPENAGDQLHFLTKVYPFQVACGVGRYAKLCGIEWSDDFDEFRTAENRCLKCWVYLASHNDYDIKQG